MATKTTTRKRTTKKKVEPVAEAMVSESRPESQATVITEPVQARTNGIVHGRPPEREVAECAYFIYLSRGRIDGYELEDWLKAERDLERASA